MTNFPGRIAVIGGGSWATALAKILLNNCDSILWHIYREDRIEDFRRLGHNPAYLSDVAFDTSRITFSTDINAICSGADTLLLVMPSPYFKATVERITVPLADKYIVSAVKGIVPDDYLIVSDYLARRFGCSEDRMLVVSGPCHAEEVALGRRSFLTVGCKDTGLAERFAPCLAGPLMHTVVSSDVVGIEYAAVLKNVYAIAAGIVSGYGDNFQAVLVSNAIREMERFVAAACPGERNICDSVYLGDLLVTCYSSFSRNHNFGTMLGRGYSVDVARMEMKQTVEGYYGTMCIHELNGTLGVDMPIMEAVYAILYKGANARRIIPALSGHFI